MTGLAERDNAGRQPGEVGNTKANTMPDHLIGKSVWAERKLRKWVDVHGPVRFAGPPPIVPVRAWICSSGVRALKFINPCPFCGRLHGGHGGDDGHRISHCGPLHDTPGYFLQTVLEGER